MAPARPRSGGVVGPRLRGQPDARPRGASRANATGSAERLGLGASRVLERGAVRTPSISKAFRAAQEKLTLAHAEALPALADAPSVQVLASHMVDQSRHLTLVGLWIEAEERRG